MATISYTPPKLVKENISQIGKGAEKGIGNRIKKRILKQKC